MPEAKALPPAIALALQTMRPKLLRELAEEASEELGKLSDAQKVLVLKKSIQSVATLLEKNHRDAALVSMYEEMMRSIQSASSDLDDCCEEVRERASKIHESAHPDAH